MLNILKFKPDSHFFPHFTTYTGIFYTRYHIYHTVDVRIECIAIYMQWMFLHFSWNLRPIIIPELKSSALSILYSFLMPQVQYGCQSNSFTRFCVAMKKIFHNKGNNNKNFKHDSGISGMRPFKLIQFENLIAIHNWYGFNSIGCIYWILIKFHLWLLEKNFRLFRLD